MHAETDSTPHDIPAPETDNKTQDIQLEWDTYLYTLQLFLQEESKRMGFLRIRHPELAQKKIQTIELLQQGVLVIKKRCQLADQLEAQQALSGKPIN